MDIIEVTIFKRGDWFIIKPPPGIIAYKGIRFLDIIEIINYVNKEDLTIIKFNIDGKLYNLKEYKLLFPENFI